MSERPEELKALYAKSTRLAPGLYRTPEGNFLVNCTEFLQMVGLPDTAENRELVAQMIEETSPEHFAKAIRLGFEDKEKKHGKA